MPSIVLIGLREANELQKEKALRFTIDDTQNGQPSWWLYGDNNEMVVWAGETFDSTTNAHRAAAAFKAGASAARYEIYADRLPLPLGAWRSSDKVAASGESFSSKDAASRAAANVRANAGGATGP